jgi:hypothetical protein
MAPAASPIIRAMARVRMATRDVMEPPGGSGIMEMRRGSWEFPEKNRDCPRTPSIFFFLAYFCIEFKKAADNVFL